MSDKPVIGFIGLGIMGCPMARNLQAAGYELVLVDFDSPPPRLNRLAAKPPEHLIPMNTHEVGK